MKYIVFESGDAVVFSNGADHKAMANGRKVRSAGFCFIETGRNQWDDIVVKRFGCYGDSQSLGVKSMPEDSEIVKQIFIGMV